MNRSISVTLGVTAVLMLGVSGVSAETIEDIVQETLAFAPGSHLEVSNTNGDIEVTV